MPVDEEMPSASTAAVRAGNLTLTPGPGFKASGSDQQTIGWSNKNCWPKFPPNYWHDLHSAHHRWGGSKSEKYEIKAFLSGDNEMLWEWAEVKIQEWLNVRRLGEFITLVERWVWPGSGNGCMAFTYKYDPPTKKHQQSHDIVAHAHPAMREATKRSWHEANTENITTFHGTTFPNLARILHTHELMESSGKDGMETHVSYPCVYSAEEFDHAAGYALPSCPFGDNLYTGVVLELQVRPPYTFHGKTGSSKRHGSNEVLSTSTGVTIVAVHILYNQHIKQGAPRMHAAPEDYEILPPDLAERVKQFNKKGRPEPLKPTNWW